MKMTVEFENMSFYSFHGCYDTEKLVGNRFLVDLKIEYDAENAALNDDLEKALNYLSVYEVVKTEMCITSNILENVVDRILIQLGLQFPQILSSKVKVSKLAPPLGGQIQAVSLTGKRKYDREI